MRWRGARVWQGRGLSVGRIHNEFPVGILGFQSWSSDCCHGRQWSRQDLSTAGVGRRGSPGKFVWWNLGQQWTCQWCAHEEGMWFDVEWCFVCRSICLIFSLSWSLSLSLFVKGVWICVSRRCDSCLHDGPWMHHHVCSAASWKGYSNDGKTCTCGCYN